MIDEAQNLTEYHYNWLIGLYNELYFRDIQLITLFVGQEQLKLQKQSFLEMGMAQIVGRFMVDSQPFWGVRSLSEIKEILNAFDSKSDYSENLYTALKNINLEHSISPHCEIPLYSFIPIVREALLQLGDSGQKLSTITVADWENFIKSTMYIIWMKTA